MLFQSRCSGRGRSPQLLARRLPPLAPPPSAKQRNPVTVLRLRNLTLVLSRQHRTGPIPGHFSARDTGERKESGAPALRAALRLACERPRGTCLLRPLHPESGSFKCVFSKEQAAGSCVSQEGGSFLCISGLCVKPWPTACCSRHQIPPLRPFPSGGGRPDAAGLRDGLLRARHGPEHSVSVSWSSRHCLSGAEPSVAGYMAHLPCPFALGTGWPQHLLQTS